ncbi:MAG: hypothetical protein ABIJ52_10875 [Pseudomonadota bacterium]|nr:hypothetical protein [Pseudomonadota bacterium]MBU1570974.1 hypothetical protein [Pseudomonadota bacterium]
MPLSFRSENHGIIAFGFFNIESDMLLLQNLFFFADRFCEWMGDLAQEEDTEFIKFEPQVYVIENPDDIGDLMGAIHGVRFNGFIGRLYRLFPFPEDPESFKQNPDGVNTQAIVRKEIKPFSTMSNMPILFHEDRMVHIGPYLFDLRVFHELIRYVWQGGYPRWKNGVRPSYVMEMKDRIENNCNDFFKGICMS